MAASGPFAPSNAGATDFGMPEILATQPMPIAELLSSLSSNADRASARGFAHGSASAGVALVKLPLGALQNPRLSQSA